MDVFKKLNKKNISLILSYLTITAYIVFGNCLTFNLGNRMPVKVAEIIAALSCIVLLIIHKKDVLKIDKGNWKIVLWFAIASIPLILNGYEIKQIAYGLLYSVRIIATLAATIIVTNVFKKYEISRDKICNYFINNYLVVCVIGIFQLIVFPVAFDFYDIFYNFGVYFSNPDPHINRLLSTYFDPNFLSACLIIPTILAVDFFSKTGKKKYLIEAAVFIWTIVLTVSRSGVAGVCLALFIYAIVTLKFEDREIKKSKGTKRAFFVMITTAVIFIFLTVFTNVRVFKRILGTLEDDSTYARVSDWSAGMKVIEKTPEPGEEGEPKKGNNILGTVLGIGYNMIGFSEQNAGKVSSAVFGNDSSLILIWISSGVIGSLYFVYMVRS